MAMRGRPWLRVALGAGAAWLIALGAAAPAAGAAGRTTTVRVEPDCGYSTLLHKEYACRVVTVAGPGYYRRDVFSIGLGMPLRPWETVRWQYRWAHATTAAQACKAQPDTMPRDPYYQASRWVTAERMVLASAAHTVTTRTGMTRRVAASVRVGAWGTKDLTIRIVRNVPCATPTLGVALTLPGLPASVGLASVVVLAPPSLAGGHLNLGVVGAVRGHAAGHGATPLAWPVPAAVSLAGGLGTGRVSLGGGLAGPGSKTTASVFVVLRPGTATLRRGGASPGAPAASVQVSLVGPADQAAVPVPSGSAVDVAVPRGSTVGALVQLEPPASLGPGARLALTLPAGAAGAGASVQAAPVPLAIGHGNAADVLVTARGTATGGHALLPLRLSWTAGGRSADTTVWVAAQVVG